MEVSIKGGSNGDVAKVDKTFAVKVRSTQMSEFQEAICEGRGFVISTGIVNLTTANDSDILYVKNNDTRDMIFKRVIYNLGNSATGSGDWQANLSINPTTGTLISNAVAAVVANINTGKSDVSPAVTAYKGVEGDTITDGIGLTSLFAETKRHLLEDVTVLPANKSIAFSVKPPAGNTGAGCNVVLEISFMFVEPR